MGVFCSHFFSPFRSIVKHIWSIKKKLLRPFWGIFFLSQNRNFFGNNLVWKSVGPRKNCRNYKSVKKHRWALIASTGHIKKWIMQRISQRVSFKSGKIFFIKAGSERSSDDNPLLDTSPWGKMNIKQCQMHNGPGIWVIFVVMCQVSPACLQCFLNANSSKSNNVLWWRPQQPESHQATFTISQFQWVIDKGRQWSDSCQLKKKENPRH